VVSTIVLKGLLCGLNYCFERIIIFKMIYVISTIVERIIILMMLTYDLILMKFNFNKDMLML
jgi:hypothetical protein